MRPRTRFVAQFIGETNLMEGTDRAAERDDRRDGAGRRHHAGRRARQRPEGRRQDRDLAAAGADRPGGTQADGRQCAAGRRRRRRLSWRPSARATDGGARCSSSPNARAQAASWAAGSAGFACFQPEDCTVCRHERADAPRGLRAFALVAPLCPLLRRASSSGRSG